MQTDKTERGRAERKSEREGTGREVKGADPSTSSKEPNTSLTA